MYAVLVTSGAIRADVAIAPDPGRKARGHSRGCRQLDKAFADEAALRLIIVRIEWMTAIAADT
jgi:hypothetical protein